MLSVRSLTRSCSTHSEAVFHCAWQLWSSHAHPESRAERLTLFEQEERIHALHANRMNSNLLR